MKAVKFIKVGKIELTDVNEPVIQHQTEAKVKITTTPICGTDLHLIRGTMPGVKSGTILGHEAVGIIEKIGSKVENFKVGDRVIIPSTIGCGYCEYCKREIYSQCDNANPNGKNAGTAFFGGPKTTGPFNGMQAQKVLVPYADVNLIKIPDGLTDEQVILLSDILPTAYMAVMNIEPKENDIVAVFGCGPVGQLVILCLKLLGIKNIIAIDNKPDRLKMAKQQGATIMNFNEVDPEVELKKLNHGHGPNKIIDAVGVDAEAPKHTGFIAFFKKLFRKSKFSEELKEVAPKQNPNGGNWYPGDAPSQVVDWATKIVAKAGNISIIGVYPTTMRFFNIGEAMGKNLTIKMGNCNHRKYIPELLGLVRLGKIDLLPFITHIVDFEDVINAYKHFDKREDGWIKVILRVN